MKTTAIKIEVGADLARAFADAPVEERRKLEVLLALRLRELTSSNARPLAEVMDEIGNEAQARGLTPEVLKSYDDSPWTDEENALLADESWQSLRREP